MNDERYLTILGNPGSNPLELFWDMVDALDQRLEDKERIVLRTFDSKGLSFSENMSHKDYRAALGSEGDIATLKDDDLREVYETVRMSTLL